MDSFDLPENSRLGIIAGRGFLPSLVLDEALNRNLCPIVVYFKGNTPTIDLTEIPCLETTLGKIGQILEFLENKKVKRLIFAGGVPRPSVNALSFDAVGLKWLKKLGLKAFGGDDTLLKGICEALEKEGFTIVSPKNFLPDLALKSGNYAQKLPSERDLIDIERGREILNSLSSADVGQACVVQEGIALGIEAIEGTAELIARCVPLKRNYAGGTLVKLAKTNQSKLIDLPTVGVDTIKALHAGNYAGIAVSAETTQVLRFDEVIGLCDEFKMFFKVIPGIAPDTT